MAKPSLTTRGAAAPPTPASGTLRLVLSWGLVGIPLAWGVYQTIVKSLALFQ